MIFYEKNTILKSPLTKVELQFLGLTLQSFAI